MTNIKRNTILIVLVFFYSTSHGQHIRYGSGLTDIEFLIQTKTIDEFITRFNGKYDNILTYEIEENYGIFDNNRSALIRRLISNSIYLKAKDSTNLEAIQFFIQTALDSSKSNSASLDNDDSFAILDCTFIRENKSESVRLYLIRKKINENGYIWEITNVQSNKISPQNRDADSIYINPMSHGTDFMGIARAFDNTNNFVQYTKHRKNQKYCLEQFIIEISTGILKFKSIDSISYCFFNVNSHIFYVTNDLTASSPCGWLISDIEQKSELLKKEIYSKLKNDCN